MAEKFLPEIGALSVCGTWSTRKFGEAP